MDKVCPYCDKIFAATNLNYYRHVNQHTQIFFCKYSVKHQCNYSSSRKDKLEVHELKCGPNKKACPHCGRTLKTAVTCKRHIARCPVNPKNNQVQPQLPVDPIVIAPLIQNEPVVDSLPILNEPVVASSTSVPQPRSRVLSALLSPLLKDEKKHTRKWLRDEINQLVDPMLDSIFQRLTNKLVNGDLNKSGDGGNPEELNRFDHAESPNPQTHQPSVSHITQQSSSSTSVNLPESMDPESTQPNSIGNKPKFDPKILTQVKREIEEENEMAVKKNMMDNTLSKQIEDCVKQEFDDGEMIEDEEENIWVNDFEGLAGDNEDDEEEEDAQVSQMQINNPNARNDTFFDRWLKDEVDLDDETSSDEQVTISNQTHNQNISLTPSKSTRNTKRKHEESQPQERNVVVNNLDNKHLKKRHSIGIDLNKPFKCDREGCHKSFNSIDRLNLHLRDVHSNQTFPCPIETCNKTFKSKKYVNQHVQGIHFKKKFHCPVEECEQAPKQYSNGTLVRHLKKKHLSDKHNFKMSLSLMMVQHKCDHHECYMAFSSRELLLKHIEREHPRWR